MKRIIFIALLLAPLFNSTMAQASCGAGQGSGVDMNVMTKEITYYCYDIEVPSQTQLEIEARQKIEQNLSQEANNSYVTQIIDSSINVTNLSDEPLIRPRTIDFNVATGSITEREYNDDEMAQWRIDQTYYQAKSQALQIARDNLVSGINTCVSWSALELTGAECHYQPVNITQIEIDNEYNYLYELWSPNWFEMLLAWLR